MTLKLIRSSELVLRKQGDISCVLNSVKVQTGYFYVSRWFSAFPMLTEHFVSILYPVLSGKLVKNMLTGLALVGATADNTPFFS